MECAASGQRVTCVDMLDTTVVFKSWSNQLISKAKDRKTQENARFDTFYLHVSNLLKESYKIYSP